MLKKDLNKIDLSKLKLIYNFVGKREGWDFSRMKTEKEPTPWDYLEIVKNYLRPSAYVLDIGTGGGEKFIKLSANFKKGVGIDPYKEMIDVAKKNAKKDLNKKVVFKLMGAENIGFVDNIFDVVINRHALVVPEEIARVLKSGGYFITQQVTNSNMNNIKKTFRYRKKWNNDILTLKREFEKNGCTIIANGSYSLSYWVKDIESLIFWLKAVDLPEGFTIEKHGLQLIKYMKENLTDKGFATNESRDFLIAKKN